MWDTLHRPLKFGDVLGQQGTVQLLKARLARGSALDVSYIFAGGHGQGKTTLARILARAMLCQDLNKADPEPCNACDNCQAILNGQPGAYVEQDAASGGTIDNIRAIVEDLPFAVFNAPKRVYVFDEAHRMSRDAQDVLLKPLEEKKMVGIFCTTEPEKIRGPIRSRCEEYQIRKITREDVLARMKIILTHHSIEHEDDAILTVIDYSGGHVRDIVNRLEMIAQMGKVTVENVREYLHLSVVSVYYEILLSLGSPKHAIGLIEQLCERVSPEEVSAGLAEAAMNSFRLKHGMFADFVYVDKTLGQRLYDAYQDNIIKVAEFFLRQRHTSKVALICDVVSLAGGIPTQQAAPIVVQAPVLTFSASGDPSVPITYTTGAVTPPTAISSPSPVISAPAPKPAPTQVTSKPVASLDKSMLRQDGIGSIGSGDVAALTSVDHHGVPKQMPRGRSHVPSPVNFSNSPDAEGSAILTPEQWKREFEITWRARG